ncbi:hypothetical protein H1235_02055 [Pseudoxanthomonas sp. NC8]|nr:hypothetical protein H1235_02055 [Pseudoxanthomonas sp. NC8]
MDSNAGKAVLMSVFVCAGVLAGCASTPRDSSTFGRGVAGEVQSVEWGTIRRCAPWRSRAGAG